MKTIGFYSYKGGTGKSLMAANLAACLSRLGKHCVVVDCDVEGPSVHNKFGRAGKGATGRGGLIGLVNEHFEKEDWATTDIDSVSPSEIEDIEQFLYEMPAPWDPTTESQHGPTGTIKLLPAGDIYGADYWNVVWSPLWHGLFTVYHRYSLGQIGEDRYRKILRFFRGIKSALANLSPTPDYMIVDFRAGASELSTTLINAWIDTLVYAFSFNEDSIDYLDRTFAKIWHAGHDRDTSEHEVPFEIELVLSRVPTSIEFRGDRMLWSALRAMRLGWDDIHILHSDRDIELAEEVRTGYQATPQNRRLTQDYMKLFSTILDPADFAEDGLAHAIGLREDLEEIDRIFTWESERGAIINPSDDSRNVSFKVETFQVLLQGLEHGLAMIDHGPGSVESLDSIDEKSPERIREVLFTAGRRCGEKFGDALAAGWHKSRDLGIEAKIRKWCEFDSDVGFGRFQMEPQSIEIKGQKLLRCDIYLRESFLTPAVDTLFNEAGDHRFCGLMTGYIQGVLSRILGYDVSVAHDLLNHKVFRRDQSVSSEFRSENCLFVVTTPAAAQDSYADI